jgi:hypothetical protein
MAKTVKTPLGTELPLVNLKGKDYLMVGHRLQWFNEVEKHFDIVTEFLLVTEEQTICKAHIVVRDAEGKVIRQAQATKRETKKDFPDHTEKSETSAIGRALAMLGYGTQFALADLEEGERLADSPVLDVKNNKVETKVESAKKGFGIKKESTNTSVVQPNELKNSLASASVSTSNDDGWN